MVGQLANFMRNFGKAINYIIDSPELEAVKKIIPGIGVGYDIYSNLNKLDDPNNSQKDIAVDIAKAVVAPTALIPGIGTVIQQTANKVIDSASYISDVLDGRKDAPPKGADINSRNNPIGNFPNQIINSVPFNRFFNNFGRF
jgi:hypothetical protein